MLLIRSVGFYNSKSDIMNDINLLLGAFYQVAGLIVGNAGVILQSLDQANYVVLKAVNDLQQNRLLWFPTSTVGLLLPADAETPSSFQKVFEKVKTEKIDDSTIENQIGCVYYFDSQDIAYSPYSFVIGDIQTSLGSQHSFTFPFSSSYEIRGVCENEIRTLVCVSMPGNFMRRSCSVKTTTTNQRNRQSTPSASEEVTCGSTGDSGESTCTSSLTDKAKAVVAGFLSVAEIKKLFDGVQISEIVLDDSFKFLDISGTQEADGSLSLTGSVVTTIFGTESRTLTITKATMSKTDGKRK